MAYATIDKGSKYFNTITYTGTGASLANTGVGFQPDWVWIKGRSGATDHGLYDAVRGVQKDLVSNASSAETTQTTGLTAFGSDGFTVGALAKLNTSSATYCSWNWLGSNTTVSNTSGTITSTVSANTTSGFSVITFTANGTAGATVGHGLGVAPSMFIIKCRSNAATDWMVYHKSTGASSFGYLDLTNAFVTSNTSLTNGVSPTSSVITLGGSGNFNVNGYTNVIYAFAEVKGFSKFGSYTGNGSTDGTFVYTGFKPAYIMVKNTGNGGINSWNIFDNARSTYNVLNARLYANSNASEGTGNMCDFLSNGIKFRNTDTDYNGSANTYIYMAFASNPFVTSGGIPVTAR